MFSSDLMQEKSNEFTDSFNRNDDTTTIVVCNDPMTSCGLNLHQKCGETISLDCPPSRAIKYQQEG